MAAKRDQTTMLLVGGVLAVLWWMNRKAPFNPGIDVRIPTMERDPVADAVYAASQTIDLRRRGK
jgi:hypothetical protein